MLRVYTCVVCVTWVVCVCVTCVVWRSRGFGITRSVGGVKRDV